MPRVHGLLTTYLKYNKLKLYKGNSPSDFLGTRQYAIRRGCRVMILISLEMRSYDLLYTYKIVLT